jgi:hypothetical protein
MCLGCDAEEFSIQVRGVTPVDPMNCQPDTGADGVSMLSRGTLDLVLASSYEVNLAVVNVLQNPLTVNNLEESDGFVNTTDVNLTNAVVRYLDPDEVGLGFEEEVNIPLSGLLPSGVKSPINQRITIITSNMANDLRDSGLYNGRNSSGRIAPTKTSFTLIISIKLQGKTLDGKRVESNEIQFPIDLCTGCRVSTQGRADTCDMVTDEELEKRTTCPGIIGRDDSYASCALCQQVVTSDSFAPLCLE